MPSRARVIYFARCYAHVFRGSAVVDAMHLEGNFRARVAFESEDAYFVLKIWRRHSAFRKSWYLRDLGIAFATVQKEHVLYAEHDSHAEIHDKPIPASLTSRTSELPLPSEGDSLLPEDS